MMKIKYIIFVAIFLLFSLRAINLYAEGPFNPDSLMATPSSAMYWGYVYVSGDSGSTGDQLGAFDPDNVMCGAWVVNNTGIYGLMAVYGDDTDTPDVDEGAETGDTITFHYWDASEDLIYYNVVVDNSWDDGTIENYNINIITGSIAGTVTLIGGSGNVKNVEVSAGGNTVNPDSMGYYFLAIQPGIYDVKAKLNNYRDSTITDVEVIENQSTTGIDFVLRKNTIEVNWNGTGDYIRIQDGIENSIEGDTVVVYPGVYLENIDYLGKNITVKSEEGPESTIINGNQNGSVVTFSSVYDTTTVLYGFTLTNGYIFSTDKLELGGGGIFCDSLANPTIKNMIIKENYVESGVGGGIYFKGSETNHTSPKLKDVVIYGNYATNGSGIFCNYSNPILKDVIIKNNMSESNGGGIYNKYSFPNLKNVVINNNSSNENGGGIYCEYSNPIFDNVTICNNSSTNNGGGIFVKDDSSPNITNCIISGNNNYGIYIGTSDCSPTLSYSDIWNNTVGNFGGYYNQSWDINSYTNSNGDSCDVYYNIKLDPLFVDEANEDFHLRWGSPCIDSGNPFSSQDLDGTISDMGAYYFDQSSITADFEGIPTEGIFPLTVQFNDKSCPGLVPITSWYWEFGDGYTNSQQNPIHVYQNPGVYDVSLIVSGAEGSDTIFIQDYIKVYNQIKANFVADDTIGTAPFTVQFSNLSIGQIDSVLWNFGDGETSAEQNPIHTYLMEGVYSVSLTIKDSWGAIDDTTKIDYITVYTTPLSIIVNWDGSTDYTTIQEGINAANDGDTVLVFPGVYLENINYNDKEIIIGSLFLTTKNTDYIYETIINGNQNGRVVTFSGLYDSTTVLCGFTITNGYNPAGGGGILCGDFASPTIKDVIIDNNSAAGGLGGGIFFIGSDSTITTPKLINTTISGNNAFQGGAIYCEYSNPILDTVFISSNLTVGDGAGIYCFHSNPTLRRVTLSNNISGGDGGGIYCSFSNPFLANVTINNNSTDINGNGGGLFCTDSSSLSLTDCIISNNQNYGIYVNSPDCYPSMIYSDIWNNTNGNFGGNYNQSWGVNSDTTTVGDSCDIYQNIQEDPLFFNSENEIYYLINGSPCINTGNPNSSLDPDSSLVDMGAYYFDPYLLEVNFIADSTVGIVPFVVTFTSRSLGDIESLYWNFGDGVEITTSSDTVSHTYVSIGTFDVSLTILGRESSDSLLIPDYITVYDSIKAKFVANDTIVIAGLEVIFTDSSTGDINWWKWDFGDGTEKNYITQIDTIPHVYNNTGEYTVNLIIGGNCGMVDTFSVNNYISVYNPVHANFTSDFTKGIKPLIVSFTDLSTEEYDTLFWEFGDGYTLINDDGQAGTDTINIEDNSASLSTGTYQNPIHTYNTFGVFDVKLTISGFGGLDSLNKYRYITVYPDNDLIWPGDTDYNGIVEPADVIPIGQYWRQSGSPRDNISFEWKGNNYPGGWEDPPSCLADCNGDSLVNITDVLAICLNWNKTHYINPVFAVSPPGGCLQEYKDNFLEIYNNLGNSVKEIYIKNYIASKFELPIIEIVTENYLGNNSPNPFTESTKIKFGFKNSTSSGVLKIFNLKGQLIKQFKIQSPIKLGTKFKINEVDWNGKDNKGNFVANGIYLYMVETKNWKSNIKKMIYLR